MKDRLSIKSHTSQQSGFSLFEVLIAIVVLAVGLLGLAQMQATALINNQSAYQTSQATVMAYDIADRMRTNRDSIGRYLTSFRTLEEARTIGGKSSCTSTTGECTSSLMAQNDLYEWDNALTARLPSPTGTITVSGDIYTVAINWDDNRDGVVDSDDPNFQMSFQP